MNHWTEDELRALITSIPSSTEEQAAAASVGAFARARGFSQPATDFPLGLRTLAFASALVILAAFAVVNAKLISDRHGPSDPVPAVQGTQSPSPTTSDDGVPHGPKPSPFGTPLPSACQPAPASSAQIIDGNFNTDIKPGTFLVVNRYIGPWSAEANTTLIINAGASYFPNGPSASAANPPVPSIIVQLSTSCVPDYHGSGVYTLTAATSPLRIVSVSGSTVHLKTTDGATYSFDLDRRTYSQP